jgi:hypothetical protein
MTSPTPAQAFLSEVVDITSFIDDILGCPRKDSWHWPSFYLLYVDVDRLASVLTRTEYLFHSSSWEGDASATSEEHVDDGNAIFSELGKRQKAVLRWLWPISRHIRPNPENPAQRDRLEAHLHPKSGWHQAFLADYHAGALSDDGKVLNRTVLPILADPPYVRVDHITADCMLRRQSFDLGTPDARQALARATRDAAIELGKSAARMQACLLAGCKLEDLMHPCSA